MPAVMSMANFDLPTRSASGFLLRYIVPRLEPIHLFGMLARKLPFSLAAPYSDIIIGMGHGDEDTFTGQNEAVILDAGKYDPREVSGKVVRLLSCQTGNLLGPDIIANGAACFIGHKDDYVWIVDADMASQPWSDPLAAKSLMPVINALNALLDGKTCGEAYQIELLGYEQNALVEEDELQKACLEFNYDNLVLLGNAEARVRARPRIFLPLPPPPFFLPIT